MPSGAWAQENYGITVAGVPVTSDNADAIVSDNIVGTVSYSADDNTLTLNGATVTGSEISGGCILIERSTLTIKLMGNNTITSTDSCTAIRANAAGNQTLAIVKGSDNCSLVFNGPTTIRDFNTFTTTGLWWDGLYTYKNATTDSGSHTGMQLVNTYGDEVGYATLSDVEAYDLVVFGRRVTADNAEDILGPEYEGTVSFDATGNVLTIEDVEELPDGLYSGLANLTVKVKGNNKIYSEGSSPFLGDGTGSLTLTKDAEYQGDCSLQLISYTTEPAYSVVSGFTTFDYDDFYLLSESSGVTYDTTEKQLNDQQGAAVQDVRFLASVNLYIGETQVTKSNAADVLGDGTVSFTTETDNEGVTTNTLTLNNAELAVPVIVGLNNLTIDIQGTNTITTSTTCLQKMEGTTPALTFKSTSDEVGSLTLTNTDEENYGGVTNIGNCSLSKELALIMLRYGDYTSNTYYLTAGEVLNAQIVPSYGVQVNDMQVCAGNAADVLGDGTVSFDQATHTLTLNNASIGYSTSGSISTSLPELTIELVGNNMLSSDSYSTLQSSYGDDVTITVQSSGTTKGCLVLKMAYSSTNVFAGEHVTLNITEPLAVVSGNLNVNSGNLNVVTIGEPVDYELVVEDIRVVAANASNITNDTNDGDRPFASFDAATNTLTLDNSSFYYYWLDSKVPVQSDIQDLKVKLIGYNDVTLGSKVFKYTGAALETEPTLTFVSEVVDDAFGSLTINQTTSTEDIADGYQITNTFLPAETNQGSTGWLCSVGDDYINLWYQEAYGITVTKDDVSVIVNYANRLDVLGDANPENNKPASVQFDGRNRLVLNNAALTSIVLSATNDLPETGLDVYLEDDNTITNTLGYAISSEGAAAMVKLAFHTGGDAPGTLTYTNTGAASEDVFPGFDVSYFNKLVKSVDGNVTSVKIPMNPITDNVDDPAIIDYGNDPDYATSTALNNTTIEDVLYTLYDQQQPNVPDDGLVTGTGGKLSLVINSTMTDLEVAASDAYVPGTQAYYDAFKGLTFYVPASMGQITLYNVITAQGYAFHVRIGNQEPIKVVNNSDEPLDIVVPYACSDITVVKIYLVNLNAGGQGAPSAVMANDGRRIGPKSTVSGGLGGMSVSSSYISTVPDAAASYLMMSAGDYEAEGHGIRVNNVDVTDLPVSAFAAVVPVSPGPRRAPDASAKTFIDASGTKITGKSFSRTDGAFMGVPEETLIYLPAGNTAVGKNFVIGGICDDMELKATRENTFEVAADFTAAQATFDREFTAGDEKYYTIFLPYALNSSEIDGELYEYVDYDSSTETVNMNKVTGNTTPNTAYFFKPSKTAALKTMTSTLVKKFTGTAAAPGDESEAEGLHGVYEYYKWTTRPSNVYCFSASDKDDIVQGHFAKVGVDTYVKPFRAYLRINASSAPEFISINWGDGTTSIVPLDKSQVHQDADGWYTITGFRLPGKPTEKGIYIHKNNKVVVK